VRIHGFLELCHLVVWWLETSVSDDHATSIFSVEVHMEAAWFLQKILYPN